MDDQPVMVTWTGGFVQLPPITYRLEETVRGPWWWRTREWWIVSEYAKLGPIETAEEACSLLAMARRH
jgi:hypothetical protein